MKANKGNFMTLRTFIPLLLLVFWMQAVHAGAIEQLQGFIKNTRSARASFSQSVVDIDGEALQDSSGVVEFFRPGKFRWHYLEPFEQLVVGDGTTLWVYDKDLSQVTTRKLGGALGSSPAALLAGSDDVEQHFPLIRGHVRCRDAFGRFRLGLLGPHQNVVGSFGRDHDRLSLI